MVTDDSGVALKSIGTGWTGVRVTGRSFFSGPAIKSLQDEKIAAYSTISENFEGRPSLLTGSPGKPGEPLTPAGKEEN